MLAERAQLTASVCPPGSCTVTPTCVGARSAGTVRPGKTSNSAAMVRKRGL
ncbi:MAG: hypothetical protein QM767_30030 [Anaeromyxobacter sp.]